MDFKDKALTLSHHLPYCADRRPLCVPLGYACSVSNHLEQAFKKVREETINEFSDYIEHDRYCILLSRSAGEPTPDGGYRVKYRDKWYQSKPIDETPKCDCGLDSLLQTKSGEGK